MNRYVLILLSTSAVAFANEAANTVDTRLEVFADRNDVLSIAPTLAVKRVLSKLWSLEWEETVDAVSGASRQFGLNSKGGLDAKSGASTNLSKYDGVSGASGRDGKGQEISEVRIGSHLSLTRSNQGHVGTITVGGSNEHDYRSLQGGLSGSWDFGERNTTLSGGLNLFSDRMSPPFPWNQWGGGDKTVVSSRMGLSQLLTPLTLVAVDGTLTWTAGYMGHPYNPVSTLDSGFVTERLPRRKEALALSSQLIQGYHLGESLGSLNLEYRRTVDSWALASHTIDLKLSQHLGDETVLRLRGRWYQQGAATFIRDDFQGDEVYRSADIRLYKFTSWLAGIKISSTFPEDWRAHGAPDRWSLAYDHLWRDTYGDGTLYQLYSASSIYMQGTGAIELGWDL
jgi:Protein of unknown function (DUF3570)